MSSSSSYEPGLPLGVAILAVLIGLFGLFYVVIGLLGLFINLAGLGVAPAFVHTGVIAALFLLVVGIIMLVVATGLWDQELWALVLCIIIVGALFILDVVNGALFTLSGIVSGLLLIYLVAVHRHFS
jgi:hypothetical protein